MGLSTYSFKYKVNAHTYRFNYAYCDRILTKDSSDITLSYKSNILKDTNDKNYSVDTRNIDYLVTDNVLETNKYALFYLKSYNLSRQHNMLDIQNVKNLLNLNRFMLLNPSLVLNRSNIKNIDMLNIFLLYIPKPNIYNNNTNKFLSYPLYRWENTTYDYFFKREYNLINFKPSLNTLYSTFKDFYIDKFLYKLIISYRFIQYNKSLWLDRIKNDMLLEYASKVLNKEFKSLYSNLRDIETDTEISNITNISEFYLYKNNKNIANLLNIICLDKNFKDIFNLISTIYTYKDIKDITNILNDNYLYKYAKTIYFNYNKALYKDKKLLKLIDNLYLNNKDVKDIFKSNSLDLSKYSKYIRNYFMLIPFIKQLKAIKRSKFLTLDKYNLSTDIINFLHLCEQSEIDYICEKPNNLKIDFKPLSYSFIDILLNTNQKAVNNINILKLVSLFNKSIDYDKVELTTYTDINNIIHNNQEKSLKTFKGLLFCFGDIFTIIDRKNIDNKKLLYFLLRYSKSIGLLNPEVLNTCKSLDLFVFYRHLFLNNTTIRNIKAEANDYHKLKLWQRFWFLLPKGQTDNLILPDCDYPYEDEPVDGIDKHPVQTGKDINIGEIPLSINIMIDLINILIFMWCKFYNAFWGCTGSRAVLDTVMYVYQWLNLETSIDEQLKKGSKEHYDRCYRWLRWEAEKVILMARNDTRLNGNYYVQVLIENLIQYMLDHHFDVMPVFKDIEKIDEWRNIFNNCVENDIDWVIGKLKGIRHKILEKLKEELQ